MPQGPTIRSRLILLALACVLPAALAAAMAIVHSYLQQRRAIQADTLDSAVAMSKTVDRELASAIAGLQALATSPSLASGDLAAFQAQAQRALRYQPGNNIVLSDRSGQQRINTLRAYGTPLPGHGNLPQLQRLFVGGRALVSDLFRGGVTQRLLIAVEVPVPVGGGPPVYALSMGFFPERFVDTLERAPLTPEWVVTIYDSTGAIVARTHDPERRFVGGHAAPALADRMRREREGTLDTTADGSAVFAAFSRSAVSDWTVAVAVPQAALTRDLKHSLVLLLVGTLSMLACGVALATWLAGRIARSVRALTAPASALGLGQPVSVPQLHLREAEDVAHALQRASDLLHSRTAERDRAADAQEALRRHSQSLEHAAHHDGLTGLLNRSQFHEALQAQAAVCATSGRPMTLFFIDLDGFKPVNDRHGHAVGDEVLRLFAVRLRAGVREADVSARLGGDEFAVLLCGLPAAQAGAQARELIERLSRPYGVGGLTVQVTASIGVAGFPECGRTAGELLAAADAAMYRAKAGGKRGYVVSLQAAG